MRFAYATGERPLDGYTIKRGIGVGGFGEVYFAVSDAGKEVALKRIQRSLDVEVRGVTQCLNLKHPHLVSLYDIRYDDQGQAWVIMEYVCGESLKDVLDRNPHGLPREEIVRWFDAVADGVAYLHDHGIVHRDLKPGNIFSDQGVVKIGDYGLSKYISCSRRSGQTESVGTFHYMAPEIGKGVYGKEIDVYALGIMLFEMFTGRVPFDGESSQEIIMKHLTAEPDLSDIPPAFRAVIQTALHKDPEKRFRSVAQMRAEFQRALVATGMGHAASSESESKSDEPLYIGPEDSPDGIYFGPVHEIVSAEVVTERAARRPSRPREPIAAGISAGLQRAVAWWRHAHLSTPLKVIILLAIVFAALANAEWLIPLGVVLGALYLVYFGCRCLVELAVEPARPRPATASVPRREPGQKCVSRRRRAARKSSRSWRDAARKSFRQRSFGERAAELSGSLLMAAVVAVVLNLVLMILGGKPLTPSVETWAFYAWLTLTTVFGAWSVLAVNKLWESREGDAVLRRFVMLIVGLVIGATAFGISNYLQVRLTDNLVIRGLPGWNVSPNMYGVDGSLKLPAFLVYFGLLFAIVRWWALADPLRMSRFSLWPTAVCVFWAWVWHMFWPFPQPWGFMLAASIAVAVQLSAPWVSPKRRAEFRQVPYET